MIMTISFKECLKERELNRDVERFGEGIRSKMDEERAVLKVGKHNKPE